MRADLESGDESDGDKSAASMASLTCSTIAELAHLLRDVEHDLAHLQDLDQDVGELPGRGTAQEEARARPRSPAGPGPGRRRAARPGHSAGGGAGTLRDCSVIAAA